MKDIVQELKDRISFEQVCKDHGIIFNSSNKALCPFHNENDPSLSLHPSKSYARCFGCDKTIDVIELEYLLGKHGNRWEAAKALNDRYGLNLQFDTIDTQNLEEANNAFELLEWYCKETSKVLLQNQEALDWLKKKKGITAEDINTYKIGYAEKGWLETKASETDKPLAIKIGLIKENGANFYDPFYDRIIFPILVRGKVVGLWTRQFPDNNNPSPKWLGLSNSEIIPYKQIAFGENLNCKICVVTESISDAMAFIKIGVPAIGLIGTSVSKDNKKYFENAIAKLYFALDPDEAGEKAGYQLSKEFKGYLIELGYDKDPDEILAAEGESKFEQIVKTAMEKPLYYLDLVIEQEEIKYALEYISKLEMESEKDLWLSKLASRRNVTIRSLRKDLSAITADYAAKEIFSKSNDDKHINPIDEYSEDEIKEAREIVESTNILDQVIKVTNESGYVGEERNKKLAYLACTSRKLPGKKKSISIITKGESGSGKSELVKHVLKLMPERDVKEFTFITEKALVHSKQDLSHKIVCVFERAGGENSDYTIRTAISEEKLSIFIPVKNKDTGDFESIEKEIPSEGIVYIETTTEENTEPQNANRTFEFFTDSSPELTRQVLLQQARGHIKTERKLEQKYRIWKCLQDLLEPLPVYVPFAEELAEQFPADKVRARRDYPRLLSLIETSAFIHQKNRDVIEIEGEKYIVASEEDFNTALEIISPILSQTYKELSPKEESLINIIIEEYGIGSFDHESAISPKDVNTFSPKELLDKIIVRIEDQKDKEARHFQAYSTLRNYIKNLSAKGVLEWNGGKGAKSKYALNSDIPKITFHISLSSLANTSNEEENSNDLSELQSESLAISQSSSYSESNLPKPLDNSDISSLAKENIEEENKEGADPWD